LKISLVAESSAPVMGGGVGVNDEEERVAVMAERVVAIRGQEVEVNDLTMNLSGREAERTDSGMEGHGGGGREVAVAGGEVLGMLSRARRTNGCKQAQLVT
jgi:hypothetical protein